MHSHLVPLLLSPFLVSVLGITSNAAQPWATVLPDGSVSLVTPVPSTLTDGSVTMISGAPPDAVETYTSSGIVRTTTRAPAVAATAAAADGTGSFSVCSNPDGEDAPFCDVGDDGVLTVGGVYYVRWDPTVYPANTTVEVTGSYVSSSDSPSTSASVSAGTQAFTSGPRSAQWGFFALSATKDLLSGYDPGSKTPQNVTISLAIAALIPGSRAASVNTGPLIVVRKEKEKEDESPSSSGVNVTHAVIASVGTVVAVLGVSAFLFWWHKETRRIGVDSSMFSSRVLKDRKDQFARLMGKMNTVKGAGYRNVGADGGDQGNFIPLVDRNPDGTWADDGARYRDEDETRGVRNRTAAGRDH